MRKSPNQCPPVNRRPVGSRTFWGELRSYGCSHRVFPAAVAEITARCMSTPVSIRRATENDADSIAKLPGELGYSVDAKAMRSWALLIVAVDSSGIVVGWLHPHEDSGGLPQTIDRRDSGAGSLILAS